jgi:hypothetical protein
MSNDWNITIPIDHTKIGSVPGAIRNVKSSAKIIIAKEHETPGTDNAGGQHLKGAARVYLQSGSPTLDPEGNSLDTTATSDDGRIMVDSALSNTLKVFVATAAGVSTSWEDVRVGRVKLSEALVGNGKGIGGIASGTLTGQAIHVGQIDTDYLKLHEPATSAALRINLDTSFLSTAHATGITVRAARLDSSLMTSAIIISAGTQIAKALGTTTTNDTDSAALAVNEVYLAQSDGYVEATSNGNGATNGFTDGNNPPTTQKQVNFGSSGVGSSITMLVRKGDYFKVTRTVGGTATTIYWTPIGSGGCVKQA